MSKVSNPAAGSANHYKQQPNFSLLGTLNAVGAYLNLSKGNTLLSLWNNDISRP